MSIPHTKRSSGFPIDSVHLTDMYNLVCDENGLNHLSIGYKIGEILFIGLNMTIKTKGYLTLKIKGAVKLVKQGPFISHLCGKFRVHLDYL